MTAKLKNCFCLQDVSGAIFQMQFFGAALVSGMLQESFRQLLLEEIALLPFKKANEKVGLVNQVFGYCAFLFSVPDNPHLENLRQATQELVQLNGKILSDKDLMDWLAQDVAINKYGEQGSLSVHKDLTRHPTVIAIWNISGSCTFEILNGRDGGVIRSYQPCPRDLILLRGAQDLVKANDQRPFHRVSDIGKNPRISVTIRHNTDPKKPITDFSYQNA